MHFKNFMPKICGFHFRIQDSLYINRHYPCSIRLVGCADAVVAQSCQLKLTLIWSLEQFLSNLSQDPVRPSTLQPLAQQGQPERLHNFEWPNWTEEVAFSGRPFLKSKMNTKRDAEKRAAAEECETTMNTQLDESRKGCQKLFDFLPIQSVPKVPKKLLINPSCEYACPDLKTRVLLLEREAPDVLEKTVNVTLFAPSKPTMETESLQAGSKKSEEYEQRSKLAKHFQEE